MQVTGKPGYALQVDFDLPTTESEQWFLVRSDVHFDNPKSDRTMERRHLEQARERNARVFDFGDLFDAMQGPRDPRQDRNIIRTEEGRAAYFNTIIGEAVEFYAPYADLFAQMSPGNHETAPVRHYGFDLTRMLIDRLHDKTGHYIHQGPYAGFVAFKARFNQTKRARFVLSYTHGSGAGGPVTRGTIKGQRMSAEAEADMYYSGHTHEETMVNRPKLSLNNAAKVCWRDVYTITAPGYKNANLDGDSWERSNGHPPKPKGALWLRFSIHHDKLICEPSWAK